MTRPQISVVMGVYNEQASLKPTMQSVLSQRGVELELIVVNDGSTDQSEQLIKEFSDVDSRVRLINQNNNGLTKALINGCLKAKGNYIARQDAGDISLPGRFAAQLTTFEQNSSLAMVSTGAVFIAPDGEKFNSTIQSLRDAKEGLKQRTLNSIKGPPHHGSVMFRRDIYSQAGGYRQQFSVAQDLDLWTRMIELGDHYSLQQIYYEAKADHNAISHRKRDLQLEAAKIIFRCCEARDQSGSDHTVLEEMQIALQQNSLKPVSDNASLSEFNYFIASSLKKIDSQASKKYFKRALHAKPSNWKALIQWVLS